MEGTSVLWQRDNPAPGNNSYGSLTARDSARDCGFPGGEVLPTDSSTPSVLPNTQTLSFEHTMHRTSLLSLYGNSYVCLNILP